jgi:hypothetical protein
VRHAARPHNGLPDPDNRGGEILYGTAKEITFSLQQGIAPTQRELQLAAGTHSRALCPCRPEIRAEAARAVRGDE